MERLRTKELSKEEMVIHATILQVSEGECDCENDGMKVERGRLGVVGGGRERLWTRRKGGWTELPPEERQLGTLLLAHHWILRCSVVQ